VAFVTTDEVTRWLRDRARTTYLFDVRSAEEFAEDGVPGVVHAPGGQLVQATDHWIGTRGARVVLIDAEEVRAPMTARWLRQLGHEACVLQGGTAAAAALRGLTIAPPPHLTDPAPITPTEVVERLRAGSLRLIDLRPSMSYRKEHVDGAVWSIRPRLGATLDGSETTVALIADEPGIAQLAARDLAEAGVREVRTLAGGHAAARAAGLPMAATPQSPGDGDCIDFLFFTHSRHDGDAAAARQYLAWELALVDQLDAQERAIFRLPQEA
jgi:rhodanese-related sulfurtransferase